MHWILLLSLARGASLEPLVAPPPVAQAQTAPLTIDAPVLRAEETPETPDQVKKPSKKQRNVIVAAVFGSMALVALGGTVLCCFCFGIYGYNY